MLYIAPALNYYYYHYLPPSLHQVDVTASPGLWGESLSKAAHQQRLGEVRCRAQPAQTELTAMTVGE